MAPFDQGKTDLRPPSPRPRECDAPAQNAQYQTGQSVAATAATCGSPGAVFLREETAKRYHYHVEEARRAEQACNFFTAHPDFDDFVRLIRAGVIQI